jgi:hypothetical protein
MFDPATGIALFAAKPLVSFLFEAELNRASKRNPQDSKWTAFVRVSTIKVIYYQNVCEPYLV